MVAQFFFNWVDNLNLQFNIQNLQKYRKQADEEWEKLYPVFGHYTINTIYRQYPAHSRVAAMNLKEKCYENRNSSRSCRNELFQDTD
jgi:hypothetical protein